MAWRRRFNLCLLSSTVLVLASPALADCNVLSSPNIVTCSTSGVTTDTANSDGASPISADRTQTFSAGGDVSGSITDPFAIIGGYGLRIETTEAGAGVSFNNLGTVNQSTSGTFGTGALDLRSATGPVTYFSGAGSTVTGGTVAGSSALSLISTSAAATGDVTAHVNGTVSNLGSGVGVTLGSSGSANIVLDGSGTISGGGGIYASAPLPNGGPSNITIGGSGATNFALATGAGILVINGSSTGSVTINRSGAITGPGSGINSGIDVRNAGTGGVVVSGVGSIRDVYTGISVLASAGDISITPGAAIVSYDSGITADASSNNSTSAVTVTSGHDITTSRTGIRATTADGDATINLSGGTVSTIDTSTSSNIGLYAFAANGIGNARINMSGGVVRSLGTGAAMFARTDLSGNAIVNQTGGSVGLPGNPTQGYGIVAGSATGNTSIVSGLVFATDLAVWGLTAGTGRVDVVTNAAADSTTNSAVATQATTGPTTIANNASLTGAAAGGVISATSTGGSIAITNTAGASIASNQATPESRTAIGTIGGPTTLVNNGALIGGLTLGNAANTVSNTGSWISSSATTLGSVASTVTNSGTMILGAGGSIAGTNVSIVNTAGSLRNDGTIAGAVTITGGTLSGSGTILGATTVSGGTLSPGNSPGTLTINGNLTMDSASTYKAEVQGPIADRINVTGTASLAGTLRLVPLGGAYSFNSPYTLLSAAGGRSGTFGTVDQTGAFGDGVTTTVSYTGQEVRLTLAPKPLTPIVTPQRLGVTSPQNAFAIASAVDAAVAGGADASPLFNLYNLPAAAIPAAVNQLSGEVHTSIPAIANSAASQFLGTMLDPGLAGRLAPGGAGPGAAAFSSRISKGYDRPVKPAFLDQPFYSIWGASYGSAGRTDGSARIGSAGRDVYDAHLAVGADLRLGSNSVAGVAVSGGKARASLSGGLGKVESDVFQAGLYAMTRLGPINLSAAGSYSRFDNDVSRAVPVLGNSLVSSYTGTAWSGRIQAHAALASWGGFTLSPLAAMQAISVRSPAFSERTSFGTNAAALTVARSTDTTNRSEIGAQLDSQLKLASVPLTAFVRAAWAHYFQRDAQITAGLATLPGTSFVTHGARPDANAALVAAGLDARLSERVSLGIRLDSELSANNRRLGGTAQIRVSF
ncbi:MAG: autotransporter outer membrane beta-barrel domain-containing protein [Bosea sp. (in: a-proteobacteria)]|uniref:autotransporter outer membrane beta-barrel domain-containing protein n=1 Tax=Bosea sp. (in: a-proteobacteria) TaxID=1871050 RepID=UPI003F7BC591